MEILILIIAFLMSRSLIHLAFEGINTMLLSKNKSVKVMGLLSMLGLLGGLYTGFQYLMHLS